MPSRIRVIDLTAMPVRSFNQMLVQKIMKDRGLVGAASGKLALAYEAGIARGFGRRARRRDRRAACPSPNLLGRNVSEAALICSLPMLLVPAFRNLVEYHAELLYARERTGSRIALLCAMLTGQSRPALISVGDDCAFRRPAGLGRPG